MLLKPLTLLLIVRVGCEWVEISQRHYKKPLRPTHTHPLLATVGKASETVRPTANLQSEAKTGNIPDRPTHERPPIDPVRKVSEDDRVNKRNRIYINHTLPTNNWDIDLDQTSHSNLNAVKSDINFAKNTRKNNSNKPTSDDETLLDGNKPKGDVIIIRRTKPKKKENGAKNHQQQIAGNPRNEPTNNKESINKSNPLDLNYEGPIEVMDLSDLEYTTAYDSFNTGLNRSNIVKPEQDDNSALTKINVNKKIESPKPVIYSDQEVFKPNRDFTVTKLPTIFKDITNMRRVEILRSTKPTPTDDLDNCDYNSNKSSSSLRCKTISEQRNNNKGTDTTPYKIPHMGHVHRVHVDNTTITTFKPKPENKLAIGDSTFNDKFNYKELTDNAQNKVPRVDRPTLIQTSTETFFSSKSKPRTHFDNRDRNHLVLRPEDWMVEELITEQENEFDIKVHKVASIGNVKRVANPTKSANLNKIYLDTTGSTYELTETTSDKIFEDRQKQIRPQTIEANKDVHMNYNMTNKNNDREHITTKNNGVLTTTSRPEVNSQIERYDQNLYKTVKLNDQLPNFVTKEDKFKTGADFQIPETTRHDKIKVETDNQDNTQKEKILTQIAEDSTTSHPKNESTEGHESGDPISNKKKSNAMENLIKFLKTVTEIITRNTRRGVHGKMRYLEDLRDTIMANIEERLEAEFPDDSGAGPRRARSAQAQPRGHVEFPSSEGALMTISFLTFAVFLIKLILQVIQAYKNKTMMVMPTVVAAVGRAYNQRTHTNT